jgi:hypothetical protein
MCCFHQFWLLILGLLLFLVCLILFEKRIRYSICRTLFYSEPADIKKLENDPLVPEENQVSVKIDEFLDDDSDLNFEKILFIVGAWGSGKTHQVMKYKKSRPKIKFIYRSFIGFRTLESSYLHLLENASKLQIFLFFIPAVVFAVYWLINIPLIHRYIPADDIDQMILKLFFGAFVTFVFITNYFRITYLLGSFLQTVSSFNKKVFIIDDLDRSSLAESDQWAFLSNLWHVDHKYIVLIGDGENRRKVLDKIEKLKGISFPLPSLQETNYGLASDVIYGPKFPFQMGEWLNHITPRQFLNVLNAVKGEIKLIGFKDDVEEGQYKVFSYLTKFVDVLSSNLELDSYDRETTEFEYRYTEENGIVGEFYSFYMPKIGRVKMGDPPTQKSNPFSKLMIENLYESAQNTGMFLLDPNWGDANNDNAGYLREIFRHNLSSKTLLHFVKAFKFKK